MVCECELNMGEIKTWSDAVASIVGKFVSDTFTGWLFAWCMVVLGFYMFQSSWEVYFAIGYVISCFRGK